VAENGEEAFENFMVEKYDLVLMDMQMPVMDGYEATRIIRRWEKDKNQKETPIIAFTAHALKEEVQVCLDAGCTGHLAKPVKKKDLIEAIRSYTV
jgi:CheY-like chemotaxis protein